MTVQIKRSQSAEDYLETILNLGADGEIVHRVDVANRMKVSQAAVNKAVKLLVERGYIYEDGKHLYLTETGRSYAESVYEKHCIIRDYLISCGVSATAAEDDACNMEHLVSDETFSMMKRALRK